MARGVYTGRPLVDWIVYECDPAPGDTGTWEVWGYFPDTGTMAVRVVNNICGGFIGYRDVATVKLLGSRWPGQMATEVAITMEAWGVPPATVLRVSDAMLTLCDLPCGGLSAYTHIDVDHGPCVGPPAAV